MGIPFKDKQVGLIVERHNLGTKNLSPYYIEPPRVLPPVGWGALDGGEDFITKRTRLTPSCVLEVGFVSLEVVWF